MTTKQREFYQGVRRESSFFSAMTRKQRAAVIIAVSIAIICIAFKTKI